MENLTVKLDDSKEFDKILSDSLPDDGNIKIITKDDGTKQGLPIVMITFQVQLTEQKIVNVQSVTTMKLFLATSRILEAKYGHLLT